MDFNRNSGFGVTTVTLYNLRRGGTKVVVLGCYSNSLTQSSSICFTLNQSIGQTPPL